MSKLYNRIRKEGDPKGDIRRSEEQKRKAAASVKPTSLSSPMAPRIPDTKSSESASSRSPTRPETKKSPPKIMQKIDSIDEFELSDSSGEQKVKAVLKPLDAPKTLPSLKMSSIPKLETKPVLDDVDDFDSDEPLPQKPVSKQSAIGSLKSPVEKKTVDEGSLSFLNASVHSGAKSMSHDVKPQVEQKPAAVTSIHSKGSSKVDDIKAFDSSSESSNRIGDLKPSLAPIHKKEVKSSDFPMMDNPLTMGQDAKAKIDLEQEKMKKEYEEKKLQELLAFEKDQQRKLEQKKADLIAQYSRKLDHLQDEQDLDFAKRQSEVLNNFKVKFNSFSSKYNLLFDSIIDELINAPVTFTIDHCDIKLQPVQTEYASADKLIHELQTNFATLVKLKYSQTVERLKEKTKAVLNEFESNEMKNLESAKEKKRQAALSAVNQSNDLKIYRCLLANDGSDGFLANSNMKLILDEGDLILCESDIVSSAFTGYNLQTRKEGKVAMNVVEVFDFKQEARENAQKQIKQDKEKDLQVQLAFEDRKFQEKKHEYSLKYSELEREYQDKLKRYDQDVLDLQKEQVEKYNATKEMWDRRLHDLEVSFQEKLQEMEKAQEQAKAEIDEVKAKKTPKFEAANLSLYKDEYSHSYYKGKPLLSFTADDFDLTNDKHLDFSSSSSLSEFEQLNSILKLEGKRIMKAKDYLNNQKQDIANVIAAAGFDDGYSHKAGLGIKMTEHQPNVININTPMQSSPVVRPEMQYPDINLNLHGSHSPVYSPIREQTHIPPAQNLKTFADIDSRVEKQNTYLQQIEDELNQLTQVLKQKAAPLQSTTRFKSYANSSSRYRRGTESTWKKEQKRTEATG
ncbi:hypothetical protein HK103_002240 [Boothiomyces macroporosus]|uniref:Uncharacterized protein n=1 Tax=Boothiomyces macroporosus TaxID=261099 RepID=A0AAD5Y4V3_9FUNG|nr:hypothetical protein HK103_002240 [Boothiomyces macroporosus]